MLFNHIFQTNVDTFLFFYLDKTFFIFGNDKTQNHKCVCVWADSGLGVFVDSHCTSKDILKRQKSFYSEAKKA